VERRIEIGVAGRPRVRDTLFMSDLLNRITTKSGHCGGRPCVRGMRIRVSDVLDLLAAGLTAVEIVDEMPDLEPDDVRACVAYANRFMVHPVLAA